MGPPIVQGPVWSYPLSTPGAGTFTGEAWSLTQGVANNATLKG